MAEEIQRITVRPNGPYTVRGGIPLVLKSPVVSEHGETLNRKKEAVLSTENVYFLCRCGQSTTKPFCDGTHARIDFDGIETADTRPIADRVTTYTGEKIVIKDDRSICDHSGFCGNRVTDVWKMIRQTNNMQVRAQIMAMVERCPSGALSYALESSQATAPNTISISARINNFCKPAIENSLVLFRTHPN